MPLEISFRHPHVSANYSNSLMYYIGRQLTVSTFYLTSQLTVTCLTLSPSHTHFSSIKQQWQRLQHKKAAVVRCKAEGG